MQTTAMKVLKDQENCGDISMCENYSDLNYLQNYLGRLFIFSFFPNACCGQLPPHAFRVNIYQPTKLEMMEPFSPL